MAVLSKIKTFIDREIWRIPGRSLTGIKGAAIRALRIFIVSCREFTSDKCSLWASALTFYTLLSIVPVFAMAFGIAKGFGLDIVLKEKLMENASSQPEILTRIIEFAENFLMNVKGGIIAGIGLALLFWTIIQVLSNIEASFNNIWGLKTQRSLGRKFADYLALMLVAPVFFILASSTMVFIVSQVELITHKVAILGAFGPVIFFGLKLLPLLIFMGLLTYLYIFMPNGKVEFRSALLGGVVAGAAYHLMQWVYIRFQIGASSAGAIYGTFAALPLFLTWVQVSWRIVLYGAELSFAHQNDSKFEFHRECLSVSYRFKKLLALRIAQACVARFTAGQPPLSDEELALELEAPVRLVRELLFQLCEAKLLVVIQSEIEKERRYQPARDVENMTIQFVLEELEKTGTDDIPVAESPEMAQLRNSLTAFEAALERLPQNLPLKEVTAPPAPNLLLDAKKS